MPFFAVTVHFICLTDLRKLTLFVNRFSMYGVMCQRLTEATSKFPLLSSRSDTAAWSVNILK
jgi:hypothetical protein